MDCNGKTRLKKRYLDYTGSRWTAQEINGLHRVSLARTGDFWPQRGELGYRKLKFNIL